MMCLPTSPYVQTLNLGTSVNFHPKTWKWTEWNMHHWQFFCVTERSSSGHGEQDLMEIDYAPQSSKEENNASGEELILK